MSDTETSKYESESEIVITNRSCPSGCRADVESERDRYKALWLAEKARRVAGDKIIKYYEDDIISPRILKQLEEERQQSIAAHEAVMKEVGE